VIFNARCGPRARQSVRKPGGGGGGGGGGGVGGGGGGEGQEAEADSHPRSLAAGPKPIRGPKLTADG
jgi:hypothetical protein